MEPTEASSVQAPAPSEIEEQLERILASALFRDAERLQNFLRFIVTRTLEGDADLVKETTIGIEVFARPAFESDRDSIVRSSARRLRTRLSSYYETAGQADLVLIHIPTGTYIPEFSLRERAQPIAVNLVTEAPPVATASRRFRYRKLLAAAVLLLALCAGAIVLVRRARPVRHIPSREAVDLNSRGAFASVHHNFPEALEWYRRAAAADPNFDLAQIGLANTYAGLAAYSKRPSGEVLPLAEKAALHAIWLSPGSAAAHGALGFVRYCQWRWAESDSEFRLAKQLAPNDPTAWRRWINVDFAYGRFEHAEEILKEAAVLSPEAAYSNDVLVQIYYYERRYDAAKDLSRHLLQLGPGDYAARMVMAESLLQTGRPREALEVWRPMLTLYPHDEDVRLRGAIYQFTNGDGTAWKAAISDAPKLAYFSAWVLSYFYIHVGDRKNALALLERAAAEHDSDLISVRWDPAFDSVRNEAAYQRVVKKLGF